jgi:hypothetical protein
MYKEGPREPWLTRWTRERIYTVRLFIYLFIYIYLFLLYWDLNSLPCTCTLLLGSSPQPFFALVIFQVTSCDFAKGQPQTLILLPTTSCLTRVTVTYYHTAYSSVFIINADLQSRWFLLFLFPHEKKKVILLIVILYFHAFWVGNATRKILFTASFSR